MHRVNRYSTRATRQRFTSSIQNRKSAKIFPAKIFSEAKTANSRKFPPAKVLRYTVLCDVIMKLSYHDNDFIILIIVALICTMLLYFVHHVIANHSISLQSERIKLNAVYPRSY